ncbi:MAG: RdgB/HAM1 family non-canonical purine NTP pyrophosphatase [Anaerolineales bacterium]
MTAPLLLATNNSGKLDEMRALLADLDFELLSPADLGIDLKVEESGESYAQNACLKAKAFAQAANLPSLADDSGLEVEALDGAPGLYSARFAPKPGATDTDHRAHLLKALAGKPRPWKAGFRSAVCLALPSGKTFEAEGECAGEIIPDERGSKGFGYDPVFLIEGQGRTMAELSMDEKNRLSHRARAISRIGLILKLNNLD